MKRILIAATATLALTACTGSRNQSTSDSIDSVNAMTEMGATAYNPLDKIVGSYQDTIPGASGPSETIVTLSLENDMSWEMHTHYTQNKKAKDEESEGKFRLNGDTIFLQGKPELVYLHKGSYLQMLDADRKVPENADWYQLHRITVKDCSDHD